MSVPARRENWNINREYYDDNKGSYIIGRVVLKVAPQNPQKVYVIFTRGWENNFGQIRDYQTQMFVTDNRGQTNTEIPLPNNWSNIPWHALSLAVDPTNEDRVVIGALNMYFSLKLFADL